MTIYRRELPEIIIPGKRLGRHVEHDEESRRYAHKASGRTLVSVAHGRHIDILDQGDVGSCTGNACTGGLGTTPDFDVLPPGHPALDEQEALVLYDAAERIDGGAGYLHGGQDDGSSGLSVSKAAKNAGYISGYTHAFSITDALDALQDGPVLWGTNWLTGMDNVNPTTGLIKYTGTSRGGHELVLRRYDAAKQLVGGDNSWGTTWGLDGSFWITVADLTKSLADDGDITILTPLSVAPPIPQPWPPPPSEGATFLVSDAVATHIHHAAVRAKVTDEQWINHHLEVNFGLPPQYPGGY